MESLWRVYGESMESLWRASALKIPFQPYFSPYRNKKASNHISVTCWFSEPKPRFELGTPSLRVKCSTAELIQPFGNTEVPFGTANI